MRERWALAVLLTALVSCSAETPPPGMGDAALAADAATTSPDATAQADAARPLDAQPDADATPVTDGGQDAATADASLADAGAPPGTAVIGARCPYDTRVGLISVSDYGGPTRYLQLSFNDKPLPQLGPPTATDSACVFHQASSAPCNCGPAQVCDRRGACVSAAQARDGIVVTVEGGTSTQTFRGDGSGNLGGEVQVADPALALRIEVGALRIEVPPMSVPPELLQADGALTGAYDDPQAIDLSWQAPADSADVYSHTNINHHVGEPTFTTCVVPATAGMLHIDGAMLRPLAVATGLEFQSIEHIRFAAVALPEGCFEVRFSRPEYVNLRN